MSRNENLDPDDLPEVSRVIKPRIGQSKSRKTSRLIILGASIPVKDNLDLDEPLKDARGKVTQDGSAEMIGNVVAPRPVQDDIDSDGLLRDSGLGLEKDRENHTRKDEMAEAIDKCSRSNISPRKSSPLSRKKCASLSSHRECS